MKIHQLLTIFLVVSCGSVFEKQRQKPADDQDLCQTQTCFTDSQEKIPERPSRQPQDQGCKGDCPFRHVNGAPINDKPFQLVGAYGLDQHLGRYLVIPGFSSFMINYLLGDYFSSSFELSELAKMLGHHFGDGLHAGFVNELPTGINIFLYDAAITKLSNEIAAICVTESPEYVSRTYLRKDLIETIEGLCADKERWKSPKALKSLYLSINGYRTPKKEMDAFVSFFQKSYQTDIPEEFVKDAVYAALFNPHLLLSP